MNYSCRFTDGKTVAQRNEMSYISRDMQEIPSGQRTSFIVCCTVSSTSVKTQIEMMIVEQRGNTSMIQTFFFYDTCIMEKKCEQTVKK